MKFYLSLLMATLMLGQMESLAQQVVGSVIDKTTKKGIPYTNLYIADLHTGFRTDSIGNFKLENLPSKELDVQISIIGYETQTVRVISGSSQHIFELEPHHIELNEVIVSDPSNKLSEESAMPVISANISETNRATQNTLMEGISNVGGVDMISTGNGIGKPVVRGLSGNRVVTYSQGIRIENQQWGDEHGLGVGAVGIKRVEVFKGPNSLLYGSDALGGVLFFVDDVYAAPNSINGFIQTTFLNNALSGQASGGIKIHKKKYKQNFFLSSTSNADYAIPNGDRVVNTRFDELNFKTSLGFNNSFWVGHLRYSYLENNYGITEDDSLYHRSTERSVMLPFQHVVDHKVTFDNVFFAGKSKFDLTLGYTANRRKEFEDSKDDPALNMLLETGTYNLRFHAPINHENHSLIIGSQGMMQENINSGEEILIPDAITQDAGLFGLYTARYGKFRNLIGLRFDRRNLHGMETATEDGLIPSIFRSYSNANYSFGIQYKDGNHLVRLNLSSGFRAPNTAELLSNGEHEGSNRYEIGNPDLISENANQLDLSYTYGNEHVEFTLNPFYNVIGNYISLFPTDSIIDGSKVYVYRQNDARLYGGEIGIHFHPHALDWLHFESTYAYLLGEDKDGLALSFMPANNINSMLKAEIKEKGRFGVKDLFIQHIYKFDQNRTAEGETKSPAYQLFHIGANLEYRLENGYIGMKFGVNNILNEKFIDHLSRLKDFGVPGQGRNLYAGLSYNF